MSLATEKKLDHLHWPLVLCTILICALGIWNLGSATKNALNPMLVTRECQLVLKRLMSSLCDTSIKKTESFLGR